MAQHPGMRGLPILSGPPPVVESAACRQCGRDFNVLFRRGHACGHCGFEYCSSCLSDGQALMPRRGPPRPQGAFAELREALRSAGGTPESGQTSGYDPEPVCVHCLAMLQVTAAPVDMLRSLPLKRLKEYLSAYNIPVVGVKEKEGLVEAVVKARNPRTGTLSPEHESFYRRRSVPRHAPAGGASGGGAGAGAGASTRPPPPNYAPRPPPPNYARGSAGPQRAPGAYPQPPRNQARAQSRPQAQTGSGQRHGSGAASRPAQPQTSPKAARSPPAPVPTILSLVALPRSYLSSLSIGTLKAILYENHVRVDFKQVLEKDELIGRVAELLADERRRLERQRAQEEREAAEAAGIAVPTPPTPTGATPSPGETTDTEITSDAATGTSATSTGASNASAPPPPTGPPPDVDRGLCVVCQDEEATLAVVDCGHLAMCSACSDLILATSKECPLCRTRIVTPQRLIRIYRV